MNETTLIVVRHGNTFNKGDVILRVGARTDLPLTDEGRAQGRRVGTRLRERGSIPTAFYSAPLRRTLETVAGVVEELAGDFPKNADLTPRIEPFLTELDYGEDDGRPESDVARRLGKLEPVDAREVATKEQDSTPEEDAFEARGKAALKRWDKERRLPVGWAFLAKRVERLDDDWRRFAAKVAAERFGEVVVAATSNGIARFSPAILPENAPRPDDLKLATGAFGVFVFDGTVWRLDAWNVR